MRATTRHSSMLVPRMMLFRPAHPPDIATTVLVMVPRRLAMRPLGKRIQPGQQVLRTTLEQRVWNTTQEQRLLSTMPRQQARWLPSTTARRWGQRLRRRRHPVLLGLLHLFSSMPLRRWAVAQVLLGLDRSV